jgi:acetyl-CoA carboxylase biotin carboxylase subunit
MIKKVLIANRGEIAIRVMRACRELGIATVAVFSDADADAFHIRMADEAYHIGPSPSNESYLVGEKIIDVAQKAHADAIHPGYGFLAENAKFARMVTDAGLIWIGPPAKAIEIMGDKLAAKRAVTASNVPIVPGFEKAIDNIESLRPEIDKIGYPILIKAAAGGGGKGMRTVHAPEDLESAYRGAASEAKNAFGDDRVYIEKYITKPRHIEIQIMADSHGNCVYLGERECSIQRRHQKVIEEAPSPLVDEKMRRKMGEAAIEAARSCGYVNAGTVEFLADNDRNFYFLEMNTRLQVEHPVTELITGIDLVKEQIDVADGGKLSFDQKSIAIRGHAIECRIYAEDPDNNFMPSTGELKSYREPSGPGIRVDSGVVEGSQIPIYYDPMISKLCAWGATRDEAILRMKRALSEYRICGVSTAIAFHETVMDHDAFRKGDLSTHFIDDHFEDSKYAVHNEEHILKAAAVAACFYDFLESKRISTGSSAREESSRWKASGRAAGLRKPMGNC